MVFQILEEFETIIQSLYKIKTTIKQTEKRKYLIKKTFGVLNDPYLGTAESRQFGQDVHQQGTVGNQV